MDKISIEGGRPLKGEIEVSGSKNAALPLLFSSLLVEGRHTFHNVPRLKDVKTACLLLQHLGLQVVDHGGGSLSVCHFSSTKSSAPYQLLRQMRAGVLCLGPLLARLGTAHVSLPGGCAIGTRAVDIHLRGLKQMGASIKIEKGVIVGEAKNLLKGATVVLDFPTVGGTQNLMMAACLASSPTQIENAAREPEVKSLAEYLKTMGAKIEGAGSKKIQITPQALKAAEYTVPPDRIEAGTFLLAGAITKGSVTVVNLSPSELKSLLLKLRAAGFDIQEGEKEIHLRSPREFSSVDIVTDPYPGFPTDLQAQFLALLTQGTGTGLVTETVFENRFMHIQELVRLGACIHLKAHTAYVKGPSPLQGAPVTATDLRASACLVLAGLAAKGQTTIHRVYHLDRGYEDLENKLLKAGACIRRVKQAFP